MAVGDLAGVPVAGVLGDQGEASLSRSRVLQLRRHEEHLWHRRFLNFTLGNEPVMSEHGLVTTVAWRLGEASPVYALEGSVIAGALVQWLRDNLGIINDAREIEALARSVEGSEGVAFVPAFSG